MGLTQSPPKWWTDIPPLRRRIFSWILILAVALSATWAGINFRTWIFDETGTRNIRFHGDLIGAWYRGSQVMWSARRQAGKEPGRVSIPMFLRGYLIRFDEAMAEKPKGDYEIDYPPGRLLIMGLWVWSISADGPVETPEKAEPQIGPLLATNTAFELVGAIAAFLVVRRVLTRSGHPYADACALLAALLLWFNPAMILDAHVWPQWDAWAIPFYLFAAWLALGRRWLLCGMCLGLGAMFKGQILLTMPIFILWPLFQGQWKSLLSVIVGIFFAGMLCVSPWMIRTIPAASMMTVLLAAMLVGFRWIPRGWQALYILSGIAAALLLSGLIFDGSFGWWYVGFAYGIRHRLVLTVHTSSNLAAILSRYHWQLLDVAFTAGDGTQITIRMILISLYVIALILCAFAAARQDLRADRRVLLAIATPWVALFAFLPQMHERYFIWGAAITALAAGVSLGTIFLHLLITFIACLPLGFMLLSVNKLGDAYAPWLDFCRQSAADAAWVTVFATLILLYLALTSSPRPSRALDHPN